VLIAAGRLKQRGSYRKVEQYWMVGRRSWRENPNDSLTNSQKN
jgi:hypothetical protein